MARCFPYMPPDVWKDCTAAAIEPPIGSIKLQNKRGNRKERKKDKKREKDRKDKSKELCEKLPHTQNIGEKRKYDERGQLNEKDDHRLKTANDVKEQFEKSGLTEESGLPCSIRNPSDSDSSQDNTKRRKLTDPSVSNNHGLVLRFKLCLQKHKDAELPSTSEQPCSLQTQPLQKHSGLLVQNLRESGTTAGEPCFSGSVVETLLLRTQDSVELPASNEQPCFSDWIMEPTNEIAGSHSRSEKKSKSKEKGRHFRELMVNWNPPPLQFEDANIGDQEWLYRTKEKCAFSSDKSCRTSITEVQDHESDMSYLQPRAQYLSEFKMCALPFVVPF